jgi:hypothetical protein
MKNKLELKQLFITLFFCVSCFKLYSQNLDTMIVYPNPFESATTVNFATTQTDTISLKIYNATGNTVHTFYESTLLNSGNYSLNFDGNNLMNGIYFIQLKIGTTKQISKKLIKNNNTSINYDKGIENDIFIYPNPTSKEITITYKGCKIVESADLTGKVLKVNKTDNQNISVESFESGEYIVSIKTCNNRLIATRKILVAK